MEQCNFYIPILMTFPPPVHNISTALSCLHAIALMYRAGTGKTPSENRRGYGGIHRVQDGEHAHGLTGSVGFSLPSVRVGSKETIFHNMRWPLCSKAPNSRSPYEWLSGVNGSEVSIFSRIDAWSHSGKSQMLCVR